MRPVANIVPVVLKSRFCVVTRLILSTVANAPPGGVLGIRTMINRVATVAVLSNAQTQWTFKQSDQMIRCISS